MNDQAKIYFRRMAMVTALLRGRDPVDVGKYFGMDRKKVGNTLAGLARIGVLRVEKTDAHEDAPKFIKHRLTYFIADKAETILEKLNDV